MLRSQKNKFSLPSGITYLNGSYMGPLLKEVEKKGIEGIKRKRNPAALPPSDFFNGSEKLRQEFAKLVRVKEPHQIAIVPSVSYGLANVAANVKVNRSQNIIVAAEQFPSNVYSWMQLCHDSGATLKEVSPPDELTHRGKIWNERLLDAIDQNTKLVALGNVHWADGTKFDLAAIRQRTREVGALLVIDGTQSVGALPLDVSKLQPDALVCAGYKWLLGPYSIGLAYYSEYFDSGTPIEQNWITRKHSEDFSRLVKYQEDYQPGALRYEVGERSNFILVPMMTAALHQILAWKPENIQQYCKHISAKAIDQLRESGYWIEDEKYRGHHLFGVRLPKGVDMEKIKLRLQQNKISVSVRGDAIRVSPNVYNTESDLAKLVRALKR